MYISWIFLSKQFLHLSKQLMSYLELTPLERSLIIWSLIPGLVQICKTFMYFGTKFQTRNLQDTNFKRQECETQAGTVKLHYSNDSLKKKKISCKGFKIYLQLLMSKITQKSIQNRVVCFELCWCLNIKLWSVKPCRAHDCISLQLLLACSFYRPLEIWPFDGMRSVSL